MRKERHMTGRRQPPSGRVRVKRLHERGVYDRNVINSILDAAPLAHVGYDFGGSPIVTPTLQWREGDHIYWHGSAASRMIEAVDGADVCVAATLIDGFVLGRSAFHHSVNYRSVMLFGRARRIDDPAEKKERLKAFTEILFPGRWETLRPMNAQELKATSVLSLPIDEASAKIRSGPPKDDEKDYALDIWAGVLPARMVVMPPEDDPRLKPGLTPPAHVSRFRLG
jgi:nitroimidazol reductase NimA-like FMN-containing flavoprotein (pyridoxamine 5'-phosphate oxidase superfamily)